MNSRLLPTILIMLAAGSQAAFAETEVRGKIIDAETGEDESERGDMQQRVNEILLRHDNVDMYVCGHIHNFQHIRKPDCDIDYVVNSSGSLSREVEPIDGTVFCSSEEGYSLVTVDADELNLHMLDAQGNILHTITRRK